jgi:hypothetical protein
MHAVEISRWPFRLAATSAVVLVGGLSALLFTVAELTSQDLYRAPNWEYTILEAIPFLAAILALTALWAGIRSLARHPTARTFYNYCLVGFSGLSLILVIAMASNWTVIESALFFFTNNGGWAALGSHPTGTEIVGNITGPNGSVQSYPYVDNGFNLRTASVTAANGCFFLSGPSPTTTNFGVLAHGYQTLNAPIGNGYYRAVINLSPLGAPEPSKVTYLKVSLLQLIRERNSCIRELHLGQ